MNIKILEDEISSMNLFLLIFICTFTTLSLIYLISAIGILIFIEKPTAFFTLQRMFNIIILIPLCSLLFSFYTAFISFISKKLNIFKCLFVIKVNSINITNKSMFIYLFNMCLVFNYILIDAFVIDALIINIPKNLGISETLIDLLARILMPLLNALLYAILISMTYSLLVGNKLLNIHHAKIP